MGLASGSVRGGASDGNRGLGLGAGEKTQRGVVGVTLTLLLGMLVVSAATAISAEQQWEQRVGFWAVLYVVFLAAGAGGSGLGFIFGLPRARVFDTLGVDETSAQGTARGEHAAARGTVVRPHYLSNSNLIKVSDWLATIVVGLSLVNLGKVVPALRALRTGLEDALGAQPSAGVAAVGMIIIGVLAGFLLMYLWVSIRVRQLLEEAEATLEREIPDLAGLTLAEAKRAARESQVTLVVPRGLDDESRVTGQAPTPGTTVLQGAAVSIAAVTAPRPPSDQSTTDGLGASARR